jgi:hypothetical protein
MSDKDRLIEFFYLIADYLFYDATKLKNRVNIYNSAGGCLATVYVNSFDPDGVIIYDGRVNGSIECINAMACYVDLFRMICDLHRHPEDVITRLVDLNV